MKNWEETIYPKLNSKLDFKRFWLGALHDGIVLTNESASLPVSYTHLDVYKRQDYDYDLKHSMNL